MSPTVSKSYSEPALDGSIVPDKDSVYRPNSLYPDRSGESPLADGTSSAEPGPLHVVVKLVYPEPRRVYGGS